MNFNIYFQYIICFTIYMKYLLLLFIPILTTGKPCESSISITFISTKEVYITSSKEISHIIINDTLKIEYKSKQPYTLSFTYPIITSVKVKSGCTTVYQRNEILPVILSSYYIKDSLLYFTTETEINNSHFELQVLLDSFVTILKIQGNGTSLVQHTYKFHLHKTGYYRVVQVDYDGTKTYFKILQYTHQTNNPPINPFLRYDLIGRQLK